MCNEERWQISDIFRMIDLMKVLTLLIFYATLATAGMELDISLTHRKGVANKLIIANEYHYRRPVFENVEHSLKISNRFQLKYKVDLITEPEADIFGPPASVAVVGFLYFDGVKIIELSKKFSGVKVGESVVYDFDGIDGQIIQLGLIPYIR